MWTFETIKTGSFFKYQGGIYMKVTPVYQEWGLEPNAVNVSGGYLDYFGDDDVVEPVVATFEEE